MSYRPTYDLDEGDLETGTRVCEKCSVRKPMVDFNKVDHGRYRQRTCKPCIQARVRANRAKDPAGTAARRRGWSIKTRYGLSGDRFYELLVDQQHRCKICRAELTKSTTRIDHDHETGVVRGLLYHHCNLGLGYFRDDPRALEAAAAYIRRCTAEHDQRQWEAALAAELATYEHEDA